MDLHLTNLPYRKATFRERCQRAYYAFRMELTPDLQQVLDELREFRQMQAAAEIRSEHHLEQALSKLDGYDKSCIDSVAGMTHNWRELFDVAMVAIEQLDVDNQITIMRYMFAGNRRIVAHNGFRIWLGRHADALLDALPQE